MASNPRNEQGNHGFTLHIYKFECSLSAFSSYRSSYSRPLDWRSAQEVRAREVSSRAGLFLDHAAGFYAMYVTPATQLRLSWDPCGQNTKRNMSSRI